MGQQLHVHVHVHVYKYISTDITNREAKSGLPHSIEQARVSPHNCSTTEAHLHHPHSAAGSFSAIKLPPTKGYIMQACLHAPHSRTACSTVPTYQTLLPPSSCLVFSSGIFRSRREATYKPITYIFDFRINPPHM